VEEKYCYFINQAGIWARYKAFFGRVTSLKTATQPQDLG
jgi:hypothetical protein